MFFSSGNLAEFVFMIGDGAIGTDDVTSVAQAATSKIDSSGLGN